MNPEYKRKGKTRAEILKENPNAFKKNKKTKDLSFEDMIKINEALARIEAKIDLALSIFNRPQYADAKGYPAKSLKEKVSFFWTKGNSE